ncbi:MAG: LysM peptidoglycan-binding domain-containing protein [Pseudanabaena sp. RU_4_16]|nr:LysM peptidoglycan-binding domain-containing protein [Pseudanabaena sp. RU_4_16]
MTRISKFYKVAKSDIVKYTALQSSELLTVDQPIVIPGNVATLIRVREEDAKQRLTTKRDLLRQRLEVVEGKEVLVSHSAPAIDKQSEFTLYKVKHGDTIEAIARRHGTSQSLIAQHNKLGNLHWLELGRELKIPAGKDTSTMQTVAYNSQKPLKHAFSTPSSLKANPATDKLEPVKSLPGKTEVLAIKVNAATPMILPGTTAKAKSSLVSTQAPTQNLQPQAALPSAWDGLMQLSGSDLPRLMPSQPLLEEVATQNSTAATTSLPVETEPGVKVATALFPFSSDRLLEQNAVGANVAKVIPSTQPAQEPSAAKPSIVLPKLAVALTMQSIQSFDILEQSIDRNHLKQTPSANSANSCSAALRRNHLCNYLSWQLHRQFSHLILSNKLWQSKSQRSLLQRNQLPSHQSSCLRLQLHHLPHR